MNVYVYGGDVSCATCTPFWRMATRTTEPSRSDAVAVSTVLPPIPIAVVDAASVTVGG